jgi:hypothetical protein
VTNDGNLEVRVQYKQEGSDYQDLQLKPGESKELPAGVEKVKVVRQPGEWASPMKAGEEIKVTVKEGDKVVGTAGGYGDKVFFQSPTASSNIQGTITQGNPPAGAGSEMKSDTKSAESGPTAAGKTSNGTPSQTQSSGTKSSSGGGSTAGSITNNGYMPMHITLQHANGTTTQITVGRGDTAIIPDGLKGMTIKEPMVFSGYTFGLKAVDLEITSGGGTQNVERVPFEGLEMPLGGTAPYQYELKWDLKFKPKYDLGFGDDYKYNKANRDARETHSEHGEINPEFKGGSEYKY